MTLGNWVKDYRERHADGEPVLPVSKRARPRECRGYGRRSFGRADVQET
jgi:hypothetical protein